MNKFYVIIMSNGLEQYLFPILLLTVLLIFFIAKKLFEKTKQEILKTDLEKQQHEVVLKNIIEKSKQNKVSRSKCAKCNKKIKDWVRNFTCSYCYRTHCENHRLPEKHNCKGNPQCPNKGGIREVHNADGSITPYP